ncbi:MAG: ESPR-type extended signal peptide-containing protein [Veillonella sp.]|uniref:ESPR-type extended signal peptide-containing protein n=1 Tax=Veillonella sp. TaxID=1926307 RepID=UPI002915A72E|nr:ESPR-type extended signal peptide-containing protein [Veillonella sp.]MDU4514092.1 ESPR-type extended signal peptide-containing protein [Veillonella sp.]
MNKIFKVVWSKTKECYVVVSEVAKNNGGKKKVLASVLAGLAMVGAGAQVDAASFGSGGGAANGDGSIAIGGGYSANGYGGPVADGLFNIAIGHSAKASDTSTTAGGSGTAGGAIAIGRASSATGGAAVALGNQAQANFESSTAIGPGAITSAAKAVAFGHEAKADKSYATAIGAGAESHGVESQAVGREARTNGTRSIAVGTKSEATQNYAAAIGTQASATAESAIAIGFKTAASGAQAIATGSNSAASGAQAIATGNNATATKIGSIAMGKNVAASGDYSTAIGNKAKASGANSIAFGSSIDNTTTGTVASGDNSIAIGMKSTASGDGAVAHGVGSQSTGSHSVAVGRLSKAKGAESLALGDEAEATVDKSVAVGYKANATIVNGVALGSESKTTVDAGQVGYNPAAGRTNKYDNLTDNTNNVLTSNRAAIAIGDDDAHITRQLTGLAAGTKDTDAVNVAQLRAVNLKYAGNSGNSDVRLENGTLNIKGEGLLSTSADATGITVKLTKGDDIANDNGKAKEPTNNGVATTQNVVQAINNSYWKATAGGNTDGTPSVGNVKPGTQVTYSAGDNLKVKQTINNSTGDQEYKYSLNPVLTGITSIANTTTGPKMTFGGNSINITGGSLDMGTNKITNLAPGTADNDAVNVKQLKDTELHITPGTYTPDANKKVKLTYTNGNNTVVTGKEAVIDLSGLATGGTASTEKVQKAANGANDTNIAEVNPKTGDTFGGAGATYEVSVSRNAVKDAAREAVTVNNGGTTTGGTYTADTNNPISVTAKPDNANHNTTYEVTFDGNKAAKQIPLTYKANGTGDKTVKLDKGLDFTNGTNTTAEIGNDGVVKFNLNKDVDLSNTGSLTVGGTKVNNGGVTITAPTGGSTTNVTLTQSGLDNGGNKIVNVKDGDVSATSKDAVNGSQLHAVAAKERHIAPTTASHAAYTVDNNGDVTLDYVDGDGAATSEKAIIKGVAKQDLSNITNAGKQVITGLSNKVVAGDNVTVDETEDATTKQKTYKVNAKLAKLEDGTNTTVTGDGTTGNAYHVNVAGDLTGISSITNGGTNNGKISFGPNKTVTVDGDHSITLNASTGTIGGLQNKTFDPTNITSGQAATEDQLKSVHDTLKTNELHIAPTETNRTGEYTAGGVTGNTAAGAANKAYKYDATTKQVVLEYNDGTGANKTGTKAVIDFSALNTGAGASSWNIASDKVSTTEGTVAAGSAATQNIADGKTVTMKAGKNLTVKQENVGGNASVAFSLDKDLKDLDSVTTNKTITKEITLKDPNGGTTSTTIKKDGDRITYTNDGSTTVNKVANLADEKHITPGTYSVDNTGKVTMTYTDGNNTLVPNTTTVIDGLVTKKLDNIDNDGKKTITGLGTIVKAGDNVTVSEAADATTGQKTYTVNAVTPAVYTKADGTKVVKRSDGTYTTNLDGSSGNDVAASDVIISFQDAAGDTKHATSIVNNVGSAIDKNGTSTGDTFLSNLKTAATNTPNAAVNVRDLKTTSDALIDKGLRFDANEGNEKTNKLGSKVTVQGSGAVSTGKQFTDEYNTANIRTNISQNNGDTVINVGLAKALKNINSISNGGSSITLNSTPGGATNTPAVQITGGNLSMGDGTTNNKIVNLAPGTADTDAVNVKQLKDTELHITPGTYTPGTDKKVKLTYTDGNNTVVTGKEAVIDLSGLATGGTASTEKVKKAANGTNDTNIAEVNPQTGDTFGGAGATYEVSVSRNAVKDAAREAVTVNNGGTTTGGTYTADTNNPISVTAVPDNTNHNTTYAVTFDGNKAAKQIPLTYKATNGTTTSADQTVKLDKGLNFTGGDYTTASVGADGKVTFDVTLGTVPTVTDGKPGVPGQAGAAGKDGIATVKTVVDTINNSGWKANAKANGGSLDGNSTATVVKPGDQVNFAAGKNLTVKQDLTGEHTYTYSLNKDLKDLTSVEIGGSTIKTDGDHITITSPDTTTGATPGATVTNKVANLGDEKHIKPDTYAVANDGSVTLKYVDGNGKDLTETTKITGITNQNLSNISTDGETKIKNLAKSAINMEDGKNTKASKRDVNGVDTYKVDVEGDLTGISSITNGGTNNGKISFGPNKTVTVDGDHSITLNASTGKIGGLQNKTFDPTNFTSGQAATEDQLKSVHDTLKANERHIAPTTVATGSTENKGGTANAGGTANVYKYDAASKTVTLTYNDGNGNAVTDTKAVIDLSNLSTGGTGASSWNVKSSANTTDGGAVDVNHNANAQNIADGKSVEFQSGKNLVVKQTNDTTNGNATVEFSLSDNITVGKDGANGKNGSVGAKGADGSAVVMNGADGSIGLNGTNGANGISIKGKDGANGVGIDGKDGVTRIVYTEKVPDPATSTTKEVTHEVATMDDGLKFTGNNTSTENKQKLGSLVKVQGEGTKESTAVDPATGKKYVVLSDGTTKFESAKDNIAVEADGTDTLTVKLNKNLKGLNSIQLGGITIQSNGDNITFTTNGGTTKTVATTDQLWTIQANGTDVPAKSGKVNLVAGDHITITPDATNGKMTISATGFGSMDGFNVKTSAESATVGTHAGDTTENIKNGKTVDMQAGKNLVVTQTNDGNGNTTVNYALNKDVDLGTNGSLKTGDTTINNDGFKNGNTTVGGNGMTIKDPTDPTKTVSLTKDGLNNGGNQITNVASGGNVDTNAANIGDIKRLAKDTRIKDGTYTVDNNGTVELTYVDGAGNQVKDASGNAITAKITGLTTLDSTRVKVAVNETGSGKAVGSKAAVKVTKGTEFVAGDNLIVERKANAGTDVDNSVVYSLNKDLKGIETIKNGNTTITLHNNPTTATDPTAVTITGGNINMGGNRIVNVAPAKDGTDAVNLDQLKAARTKVTSNDGTVSVNRSENTTTGEITYDLHVTPGQSPDLNRVNNRIDQLGEEIGRVGAQGAALSALKPIQYDPLEPTQIMAGYGNYRGNSAVALGVAHYKNESTLIHGGVSWAGGSSHMMANAGVTWKVGNRDSEAAVADRYRKGPISSAYAMQQEMAAMKAQNAGLKGEVSDLKAENEQMKAQIAAMMAKLGL